jgi:hypothetical protein
MLEKSEVIEEREISTKKVKIDWGRQGGVIIAYIVIVLGFHGLIINASMIDQYGNWISYLNMDRTILFWTYRTILSAIVDPTVFIIIFIVLLGLIIVFSVVDWHSFEVVLILIPIFIIFILDIYWSLFTIATGAIYFTMQSTAFVLLFLVCFGLTYKEDIPQYGIKASLWMVPTIIFMGFFFDILMFGLVDTVSFIYQFGSLEGYLNIVLLFLTVISGSLSGMTIKKEVERRKQIKLS